MTRAPVDVTDFIRETLDPTLDPAARWASLRYVGHINIVAEVGIPRTDTNGDELWYGVQLIPYRYHARTYEVWRATRLTELGVCEWCTGNGLGFSPSIPCRKCKGTGKDKAA